MGLDYFVTLSYFLPSRPVHFPLLQVSPLETSRMLKSTFRTMSTLRQLRLTAVWLVLALVSSVLGSSPVSAQVTSEGKEYWLGFMPNYINPAQKINLFIASGTANKIKIEQFGGPTGQTPKIVRTITRTLAADEAITVNMNIGEAETREREMPQNKAIRVTSTAPCVVYGYSDNSLTTDGYLGLPITAYGKEYYSINYYDDAYSPGFDHLGGEFLIIAPYDGTEVKIKTKATTTLSDDGYKIGHREGDEWSVVLNKGQTYLVQTTGWEYGTADLTGSHIKSNKPIAFLTGHQRASIEIDAPGNSKDHLIEMIPPIDKWGTEYFMLPQLSRTKCGDFLRVITAEAGNFLAVNGSGRQLDNAGDYFDIPLATAPTVVRSLNGKRFLVMDYSYTQGYNGDPGPGDPDITTMTPKEQFQKRMIFRTPSNAGGASFTHYLTFICHKDGISQLKLKKGKDPAKALTAFGAGGVFPFPGTDYVGQRCKISGDEVTYIAEGPMPFGLYMYGFASVEGYAYPAGMALRIISKDPIYPLEAERVEDCGDYKVTLTETHLMPKDTFDDTRIAEISMIEEIGDPRWSKLSSNYEFILDPNFQVGDSVGKFELRVIDKTKDAYAAIYTVDFAENDTVYEYRYTAPKLVTDPLPKFVISPVLVGTEKCMKITLRNAQTQGDLKLTSNSVMGVAKDKPFSISPVDLNKTLAPNDTVSIYLCFSPSDSGTVIDTLIVGTECAPFKYVVEGYGATPIIYAHDKDFGFSDVDVEKCADVEVENRGTWDLVLSGQDLLATDQNFHQATTQTWPVTIPPGQSRMVRYCFEPDAPGYFTSTATYSTNIPAKFAKQIKDYSKLEGTSAIPGAKLKVQNKRFGPTNCLVLPQYIDTLFNDQGKATQVDKVTIIGPGAASFRIVASDAPPVPFVLGANQDPTRGEGFHYTVEFDPNVDASGNTVDADLVAYVDGESTPRPITHLSGSRIAPILTVVAPSANVDLGIIRINSPVVGTFEVRNTGTDVLDVTNIVARGADAPFVTDITPRAFQVQPGASQTVSVTITAGAEARVYTADLLVEARKPSCTPDVPQQFSVLASSNAVEAQGADYETVFQCLNRSLTPSIQNFSSMDAITLTGIDIIDDPAQGWRESADFAPVAVFNGPVDVPAGGRFDYPVVFTPNATGVRNAAIRFSYILNNEPKELIRQLTGIGDLVPQILGVGSIDAANQMQYSGSTETVLTVPVQFSESFAGRNAGLYSYSFDISFKRDLFSFDRSDVDGPTGIALQTSATSSYDATTGYETWTVTTVGTIPDLTLTDYAAQFTLHPRVSLEKESDIIVSNASWKDQSSGEVCYVPTQYVPAKFVYDPLCGDKALTAYLGGKSVKGIAFGGIAPNPIGNDGQINIQVNLPDSRITLTVYDALGKEVVRLLDNAGMAKGAHSVAFDASNLPTGTYFVRVSNGSDVDSRQISVQK